MATAANGDRGGWSKNSTAGQTAGHLAGAVVEGLQLRQAGQDLGPVAGPAGRRVALEGEDGEAVEAAARV